MNLLGIDVGTTSVKVALFSEDLEMLWSDTAEYTVESFGDRVEFPAERYVEIVKQEIENCPHEIGALAIDTQCETLILTDEKGVPTRKAIVWLDNRATKEAAEIEAKFGRKGVYEVTGQPEIIATWPAAKLMWVKKNEGDVWAKTKKVFLLEDYLLYCLTGEFVTEKTLQSSSLYFDINKGEWWNEMLEFIGLDSKMLPTLKNSGELVGVYNGIKVVTGAMDQVSGAIGAGVVKGGTVSVMTGTTMAILCPTNTIPEYDPKSIVPCHYNYNGEYCLLSWSPTAGMALKWFRDNFSEGFSFDELGNLAEKVPAGCAGLTFLPYLCGSTMPKYNPEARASFTGVSAEHTRGHFVRSIMESVAFMLRENLEYLNLNVKEIRAMGGAANSKVWCQIKSDVTGANLVTLENRETACLGGAILAGVGVGIFSSVEDKCKNIALKNRYTPSGEDYEKAYEAYKKYDALLNVKG